MDLIGSVMPLGFLLSGGADNHQQLSNQLYNMVSQSDDPYQEVRKIYDDLERERGLGRNELAGLVDHYGNQGDGIGQDKIDAWTSAIDVRTRNQTEPGYRRSQASQDLDNRRNQNQGGGKKPGYGDTDEGRREQQ